MGIRVFNTLTRKKEDFVPREPGKVSIYQCGVTPYDYTHMGHARQYVLWDVIRRYLKYRGYKVFCVQNVTDIDDKIIAKANKAGKTTGQIVEEFNEEFLSSMDALGVMRPDVYPKVTDHIDDIIKVISGLVEKGYAYETGAGVYFDVSRFPSYGKLSKRSLDEMLAGARVEVDERKDDPMDFALWKKAKPGEPSWDSPWGPGRPGWHIECSTMALKYLGSGFDMHGGGTDLIFPHHENEIAQSEAYVGGEPFARYWIHHEMLNVGKQKMSKSLGNFFVVRDVLKRYRPEVVRYFLLSVHYRSPANFGEAELEAAKGGWERLQNTIYAVEHLLKRFSSRLSGARPHEGVAPGRPHREDGICEGEDKKGEAGDAAEAGKAGEAQTGAQAAAVRLENAIKSARSRFIEAMDDDFNTALALAALHELATEVNIFVNRGDLDLVPAQAMVDLLGRVLNSFRELGGILGLVAGEGPGPAFSLATESAVTGATTGGGANPDLDLVEKLVDLLIDVRQAARQRKDWATADEIRGRLAALGIALEDTPQGTRWKMTDQKRTD
ncbi:MAG TPA: cysteine--tRNA ligase [Firmicutes bacterium]|nr:cysteine--tRNA ligase [Bacillota bacterium]